MERTLPGSLDCANSSLPLAMLCSRRGKSFSLPCYPGEYIILIVIKPKLTPVTGLTSYVE